MRSTVNRLVRSLLIDVPEKYGYGFFANFRGSNFAQQGLVYNLTGCACSLDKRALIFYEVARGYCNQYSRTNISA